MLVFRIGRYCYPKFKRYDVIRPFTAFPRLLEKPLPPRRTILEDEITESFLKGTGPGGQKINKTSSAVQLKHLPTGIVVKSQATRSREQNRKLARLLLAEKLDELEKGEGSRTAIKAERARAKKASASKKSRRKYRQRDEEKDGGGTAALADGEGTENPGSDSIDSVNRDVNGDGASARKP